MLLSGQAQGHAARGPQPGTDPSSAFQKADKTEGGHSVAQVGREHEAWSALSSGSGFSRLFPVQLSFEIFQEQRVHTSSRQAASLPMYEKVSPATRLENPFFQCMASAAPAAYY